MRHAIKRTCSHCQCESYFDGSSGLRLEAISASACFRCGGTGAVITLNIEPPSDAVIHDRISNIEQRSGACHC